MKGQLTVICLDEAGDKKGNAEVEYHDRTSRSILSNTVFSLPFQGAFNCIWIMLVLGSLCVGAEGQERDRLVTVLI
jgi:hypothetical protein